MSRLLLFLLRLIVAPVLIAVCAMSGLFYIVLMGLAWIVVGAGTVRITWPDWR